MLNKNMDNEYKTIHISAEKIPSPSQGKSLIF